MTAGRTDHEEFILLAEAALSESDPTDAEEAYRRLVGAIESVYGASHKDVASELQRLARQIEEQGRVEDSVRLKQRTCEVLLKLSMAARHRGPLPPMRQERLLSLAFLLLLADDPDRTAERMTAGGLAELTRLGDAWSGSLVGGTRMVLSGAEGPRCWVPVYACDNPALRGQDKIETAGRTIWLLEGMVMVGFTDSTLPGLTVT